MYGLDVKPAFFDLGYELFRDKGKMHATCVAADLTKSCVPSIDPMKSSIDVVSAQSLFHLFTLRDQKTVAQHLSELTKPIAGSTIVGRQLGLREAGEQRGLSEDTTVFLHNPDSFESLWQDIGAITGSKWKLDTRVEEAPERVRQQAWASPGMTILVFTVTRQ